MDEITALKQKCLNRINGGLTVDAEAAYIQAYATLCLVEQQAITLAETTKKQHRKPTV